MISLSPDVCLLGTVIIFLVYNSDRFKIINETNNDQSKLVGYQSLKKDQVLTETPQTFPLRMLLSALLPTCSPMPPFPNWLPTASPTSR